MEIKIINLYAPNQDSPAFFQHIYDTIASNDKEYIILCGDFNLVLYPCLDSCNYISINNPRARRKLLETMSDCNLTDIYRYFHPNKKKIYMAKEKSHCQTGKIGLYFSIKFFHRLDKQM